MHPKADSCWKSTEHPIQPSRSIVLVFSNRRSFTMTAKHVQKCACTCASCAYFRIAVLGMSQRNMDETSLHVYKTIGRTCCIWPDKENCTMQKLLQQRIWPTQAGRDYRSSYLYIPIPLRLRVSVSPTQRAHS